MAELRPILLVEDSLKDIELVLAALKKNNFANEVVVARGRRSREELSVGSQRLRGQAGRFPAVCRCHQANRHVLGRHQRASSLGTRGLRRKRRSTWPSSSGSCSSRTARTMPSSSCAS